MHHLLIWLFVFAASAEPLHARSFPASSSAAGPVAESIQTVEIKVQRVTRKGLPYRMLKSALDMSVDSVGAESPDLRASLIWLDRRPDQDLILATQQGKQKIPVSQYGAFDLPVLSEEAAAESRIQTEDGLSLAVRPGMIVELPLVQTLDLQTARRLLRQGNATRRHLPWYIKMAQFGRSNVDYAGFRLCFSTTAASIHVAGRRLEPDVNGCVKLMIENLDERTGTAVSFDSPPVFAELLLSSTS